MPSTAAHVTSTAAHVLTPTPERKDKIPAVADVKLEEAFTLCRLLDHGYITDLFTHARDHNVSLH
jgi:hypothetical protein